jgi:voltage-gated potassium channel
VLLACVILGGTAGYHVIEGWSVWHSFYVTVVAVTTVGLPDLSPAGQVFSLLVLGAGITAALYTFTLIATIVVEGGVPKRLRRLRHARMLETITNHFIICGYGRIGSMVAREFHRQNFPFVVIDRDGDRVQAALEDGVLAVEADASREEVLQRIGIERARGLVAVVGSDADNVYAVMTARLMRPDLFIISRAETEDAAQKLGRAGADRVISPYQIGALQIAQTAVRPAVVDFMQLATSSDNLELSMEQITIGAESPLVNQSLVSAGLRQRFGVVVVGIQRHDRQLEFNPEPDAQLRANDKLIVLGRAESLKSLEQEALGIKN